MTITERVTAMSSSGRIGITRDVIIGKSTAPCRDVAATSISAIELWHVNECGVMENSGQVCICAGF